MHITIIAIGKRSTGASLELQQVYEQRLAPYADISWRFMAASTLADPQLARSKESSQLLEQLKPTDSVIVLDERGQQLTNQAFASSFERIAGSHGRLVLIIGGAFGVDDTVRQRADLVWSFSKLVFPHQLMRVMVLEQLYRTYMVLQNHPYHHD